MLQFAKLPLLFEHYQAHKKADKNLTVIGFLYEHYATSSISDPDYLADMQLPFKTHNECIAVNLASAIFIQPQQHNWLAYNMFETIEINYPLYKKTYLSLLYPANIWQPPKLS